MRQEIERLGPNCRVKIIVLSRIYDSVGNERSFIIAIQQNALLIDCVIVARERMGRNDKYEALRSLTRG